jgi:hypothetical protein
VLFEPAEEQGILQRAQQATSATRGNENTFSSTRSSQSVHAGAAHL